MYFGKIAEYKKRGECARICVLTKIELKDKRWIKCNDFSIEDEIGLTKHAFLPHVPEYFRNRKGALVRFEVGDNSSFYSQEENKDSKIVLENTLKPMGSFILKEKELDFGEEIFLLPSIAGDIPEGAFLWTNHQMDGENILLGRWKVEITRDADGNEVKHIVPGAKEKELQSEECLHRIRIEEIDINTLAIDPEDANREYLIEYPFVEHARIYDAARKGKKEKWLWNALRRSSACGNMLQEFDRQYPGWRNNFYDGLRESPQNVRLQEVYKKRWEEAQGLIQFIGFEANQLELLLKTPIFNQKWEEVIRNHKHILEQELEIYSKNIEEKKLEKRRELEEYLEQEKREEKEKYRKTIVSLDEEIAKKRQELENLKQATEQQTQNWKSAAQHFQDSRDRLIKDFIGFQAILPSFHSATKDVEPNNLPIENKVVLNSPKNIPTGKSIENPTTFVKQRLLPCLTNWFPGANDTWAEVLHYAVLACRWTLIPGTAWACAYVEALGETGRLLIVNVEPTWLTFQDAWKGPVEKFWMQAEADPDGLYFLLFEDINRSLPQCWAKPWLDLLAGFRKQLPGLAATDWPPNLRFFATIAKDKAAMPLEEEVLRYFGAVQSFIDNVPPSKKEELSGHVLASTWTKWRKEPKEKSLRDTEYSREFKDLSRCAYNDLRQIRALGAEKWEKQIRIDWPKEYGNQESQ